MLPCEPVEAETPHVLEHDQLARARRGWSATQLSGHPPLVRARLRE
jgi:hypothetical protein